MSKFIDVLQQTLRGSAPPIGFRKTAEIEGPPIVIAVNLTDLSRKELKQLEHKNIDAGVLGTQGLDAATFEQCKHLLHETPLGLIIAGDSNIDVSTLVDLGCDFLVCDLKTPYELINQQKAGKIVLVESALESGLARSINGIPVDAVLVDTPESRLNLEHVLVCHRFASIISKPLLVTIRAPLTADALESLHQAGVNGIFLDTGFPMEAISDLKKAVDSLPRIPRKRPPAIPLLPRPTPRTQPEIEEEEEED